MPDRLQRQDEDVGLLRHIVVEVEQVPAGDVAVGRERQVRAVRLDRGDRQDADGFAVDESRKLGRREFLGEGGGHARLPDGSG